MKLSQTLWCVALCSAAAGPTWAGDWEEITSEDGVVTWQRSVAGTSLVEFRGHGVVNAPIVKVAAVIRLNAREVEWMEDCTGSPFFFISDRDTVVRARGSVDQKKREIRVDFRSTEDKRVPPRPDAVRMPSVVGSWVMTELDPHTTDVVYQIHADPGGSLPKWVVNFASKELPLSTIKNLRRQVLKAGYENDEMILERAIDWTGFLWAASSHTATTSGSAR
jgi:hypothetical protein